MAAQNPQEVERMIAEIGPVDGLAEADQEFLGMRGEGHDGPANTQPIAQPGVYRGEAVGAAGDTAATQVENRNKAPDYLSQSYSGSGS